jgi:thioredoxin-dependent peroxiredoxin
MKNKNIKIEEGALAPDFTLPSSDGSEVTLSTLRGKKVVLYFYPKDMTPGCTTEAHEFSAIAKKFQKAGTLVFGVSADSIVRHKKFIEKEGITFPLLSDEGKEMLTSYGVWKEKSMYGRKYMGIERSTFVIDEEGKFVKIYHKVKPEGHAVCVLEDMKK